MVVRTRRLSQRVSADCFVNAYTVRPSVPHRHVRQTVEVAVGTEYVEIWVRGSLVARHLRSFEPYTKVRDPSHFQGIFRTPAPPGTSPVGPHVSDRIARSLAESALIAEGGQPSMRDRALLNTGSHRFEAAPVDPTRRALGSLQAELDISRLLRRATPKGG